MIQAYKLLAKFMSAITTVCLLGGCDFGSTPNAEPSSTISSETASTPAVPAQPESASPEFPVLDIPPEDEVLVPVMHGIGPTKTPRFNIPRMKYSVYLSCKGKGTLTVGNNITKAAPCDGKVRRAHVTTALKSEVVPIIPRGNVRWSVSVVDTDNFNFHTGQASPANA